MNNLNVIDVSALVYYGSSSKWLGENKSYGYPVGGINYLMRHVCTNLAMLDSIVLCFDSPSFRSEILSEYKSGRAGRPDVYSQIQFAYDSLMSCGIPCEKYDGYEADDIVDWTVQQCSPNFIETIILGNDHDLCHSIKDGVRMKALSADSASIFVGNYTQMADSTYTEFNTISAKKALCGCKSDKIPAIKLKCGVKSTELYRMFLEFFKEHDFPFSYENTTNYKFLIAFANESGLFTDEERQELLARIQLVYPAKCPDGVAIVPCSLASIDTQKLFKFLTMTNDWDSIKCLGGRKVTLSDSDKELLRGMGRKLSSGEFAADNNLQPENLPTTKQLTLDMASFTREF